MEKRIAQLEGQAKPTGSRRMPGLKPKGDGKPAQSKGPRKPRRHGFARARMTPTHRVEHALENCPDCGTQLFGGWAQRTRELIDLPQAPAQVTEHVYMAHTCPRCRRCCIPKAQLGRRGDGTTAPGDKRHQPVCGPAGGDQTALPHHPVAWYRAWAEPELRGHRGGHTEGGWRPNGWRGHTGTGPRQPSSPHR